MARSIFASNDKYMLYPIGDEDREGYEELSKQIMGKYNFLRQYSDLVWEGVKTGETRIYSIYNSDGLFCGNIELQKPSSSTPRIGIDILEKYRNMGIAPSIVPMFMKKVCEQQSVEYFIVQIRDSNSHSRHVFEKMGAEFLKVEDSYYKKMLMSFSNMLKGSDEASELIKKLEAEDDPICIYKLNVE